MLGLPERPWFEQPPEAVHQVDPRWLAFILLSSQVHDFRIEAPNGARTDRAIRRALSHEVGIGLLRKWRNEGFIPSKYSTFYLDDGRIRSFAFHEWTDCHGLLHQPVVNTDGHIKVLAPEGVPVGYELDSYHIDPESGFEATVHRVSSSNEIVVCFRGTQGLEMTHNIVAQGGTAELPSRYLQSAMLVEALKTANPVAQITLTGFSLGGGQATYAAICSSLNAIVFNATPTVAARVSAAQGHHGFVNVLNINIVGDPVSNPFGRTGNFYPISFLSVATAQVGRRLFLSLDPNDIILPNHSKLSRAERFLPLLLALRNRRWFRELQRGNRRSEVLDAMMTVKAEWESSHPLHSCWVVLDLLASRLENDGIDPNSLISFSKGVESVIQNAAAPKQEIVQRPISEVMRGVNDKGKTQGRFSGRTPLGAKSL